MFFLITLLYLCLSLVSAQSCYYPNGGLTVGGDVPCSSGDGVACCPLNWQCLDNGLCWLQDQQYYGRYTCTDRSWTSSGCPTDICTSNNTAPGNEAVLKCPNGKYCCDGNRSSNCCSSSNDEDYFELPDGKPFATITNTNLQSSTTHPTMSSSKAATLSSTPSKTLLAPPLVNTPISSVTTSVSVSTFKSTSISSALSATVAVISLITPPLTSLPSSPTSRAPSNNSTMGDPSPAKSSSKQLGLILGLAIGVPIALVALGFLAFLAQQRRRGSTGSSGRATPYDFGRAYEDKEIADENASSGAAGHNRALSEIDGTEIRIPINRIDLFRNRPDLRPRDFLAPETATWSRETTCSILPVSPNLTHFSPNSPTSPTASTVMSNPPDYSEWSPPLQQTHFGTSAAAGAGISEHIRTGNELEGGRAGMPSIAELPG